jgi:hypothetical protein
LYVFQMRKISKIDFQNAIELCKWCNCTPLFQSCLVFNYWFFYCIFEVWKVSKCCLNIPSRAYSSDKIFTLWKFLSLLWKANYPAQFIKLVLPVFYNLTIFLNLVPIESCWFHQVNCKTSKISLNLFFCISQNKEAVVFTFTGYFAILFIACFLFLWCSQNKRKLGLF